MCPQLMNSPAGAAACACDRGYELIASVCDGKECLLISTVVVGSCFRLYGG